MNLTNHFLIAMPGLTDPYFSHSVIYVCEHNSDGAMGIVVNAPIDITIEKMLKQVEIEAVYPTVKNESLNKLVFNGGPVAEDRGFILHKRKDKYESSIVMSSDLALTSSRDILSVLGTEAEPEDYIVALGYAGWEAGQLEYEISQNSWLTIEADPDVIFKTPIQYRWQKAVKIMGINPVHLSNQSGHA